MPRLLGIADRWNALSLALQFLTAGAIVSLVAMFLIGQFVASQIQTTFTRNTAAATVLYVDSIIAPILPDMRTAAVLDDTVARALDETLGQGALGDRITAFRLWRRDGTILYSDQKNLVGQRLAPGSQVTAAFAGQLVAGFGEAESQQKQTDGSPLLQIYYPILQPWSGEVVAVSEISELAPHFEKELNDAVLRSWAAVALATACFFSVLSVIVFRGSRVIDNQSIALKQRVAELSDLLEQNKLLSAKVQRASRRAAAFNERSLRRLGADLHDGPAQLIALAALRLDSPALCDDASAAENRRTEVEAIRTNLGDALSEIRTICNGLVLPHIELADLSEILALAVREHEQRTGVDVKLNLASEAPADLSPSTKICIFRFVQEGLNNGYRHAGGNGQAVSQFIVDGKLGIQVRDDGPGFDPRSIKPDCLGLAGLRERVESIGGNFSIRSSSAGTCLEMVLDLEKQEAN